MASQQPSRTNFLFVNKTPLSDSLSRNPAGEDVQVRSHSQRVSKARAKLKALQDLRSGRSLWQPLTARRGSVTRADLGRLSQSNPQAENYSGSAPSGRKAPSEHAKACDCVDLPAPCSCGRHVVRELGRARPDTQAYAEYSLRQPPPSLQQCQPQLDKDAPVFAYVGGGTDNEECPDELVSRGLRRWKHELNVHRFKSQQSLPVSDHAAALEGLKEGSLDFTGLTDAQPFETQKPACKPALNSNELYPGIGRIDDTTRAYNSIGDSKEDPVNVASVYHDTGSSFSYPSTSLSHRQNIANTSLGASRVDPFSTFPVNLDKISQKCVDHFIHAMPFIEFNIDEGAPLNPNRHIAFASAMSSPAAFHAIVATGAVHLASLYGEKTSLVATHHLGQSLRLLRKGLQTFDRNTWAGTVQAMAELAATEEFRGHHDSSRIHISGLRDFVSVHGGIEALELTPRVQLLSCYVWNSISASYLPKVRMRRALYTRPSKSMAFILDQMAESSSDVSGSMRKNLSDILEHVSEFMKLLSRVMEQTYPDCQPSGVRSVLINFFRPGNGLHDMLSMSAEDKMRSGGLGPKGNHRMSCLLLITLKLLGFVDNEQAMMGYLGELLRQCQKYDLMAYPNLRLLHFLLLQDGAPNQIGDTKMAWKVVRLMQVYKLLSAQMREYVNNTILNFLSCCGTYDICITFDLKSLLQDVFSALVCSEPVEGAVCQNQN
jgi:hypothetical protein